MNTYFSNDTQQAGFDSSAKKFFLKLETEGVAETLEFETLGNLVDELISMDMETEAATVAAQAQGEFYIGNDGRIYRDSVNFGWVDTDGDFRPRFAGADEYESVIRDFVSSWVAEAIEGDLANPAQEYLKFTGQIDDYAWKQGQGWVRNG